MLNDICIFDFETTGIDPAKERVVEMAALRIRDGIEIASFTTLVHQTQPIHEKAKAAHGIEESDLVNAMDEELAFKILRNIMADSVLVAHNAIFDLGFLHHTLERLGGKPVTNPFLDTLTIARSRYPYPHTLTDMCTKLNIELTGAHRALNDVVGTWEILRAMHQQEPVDAFLNKLAYVRKFGPPKWAPDHAETYPFDYAPRTAG